MRLVVDASVAIKWFVPEIHSDAALRLLDQGVDMIAPELLLLEVGITLAKKTAREEIRQHDAFDVLVTLRESPIHFLNDGLLTELALELALATGRSIYDCTYLAAAVTYDCAVVTADRKLVNALQRTDLAENVVWIESAA